MIAALFFGGLTGALLLCKVVRSVFAERIRQEEMEERYE